MDNNIINDIEDIDKFINTNANCVFNCPKEQFTTFIMNQNKELVNMLTLTRNALKICKSSPTTSNQIDTVNQDIIYKYIDQIKTQQVLIDNYEKQFKTQNIIIENYKSQAKSLINVYSSPQNRHRVLNITINKDNETNRDTNDGKAK